MKEKIKFKEFNAPHMTAICEKGLDVEDWILYSIKTAVNSPLPWYWDTDTNEYVDDNGRPVNFDNLTKLGYNPFTEYERYYVVANNNNNYRVECADFADALNHIKAYAAITLNKLKESEEYQNDEYKIIGTQHGTEFTLRTMKLEFEKFFQDWE